MTCCKIAGSARVPSSPPHKATQPNNRRNNVPKWNRGKAVLDDECEGCGYPFDAGDSVLTDDATVVCGARCAREVEARDARVGRALDAMTQPLELVERKGVRHDG